MYKVPKKKICKSCLLVCFNSEALFKDDKVFIVSYLLNSFSIIIFKLLKKILTSTQTVGKYHFYSDFFLLDKKLVIKINRSEY